MKSYKTHLKRCRLSKIQIATGKVKSHRGSKILAMSEKSVLLFHWTTFEQNKKTSSPSAFPGFLNSLDKNHEIYCKDI